MTSMSAATRRRAVLLLSGTAIAILASAAPAMAEPGSDTPIPAPAMTSGTTETPPNLKKKKPPPPREVTVSEIIVTKSMDSASS